MPGYTVTVRKPVGLHHGKRLARAWAEKIGGEFELGPQGFVVFGFEHHRADTLEGGYRSARRVAVGIVDAATPRSAAWAQPPGVAMHPQTDEWVAAYRAADKLNVGDTLKLPNGSTISVKPDEEGR